MYLCIYVHKSICVFVYVNVYIYNLYTNMCICEYAFVYICTYEMQMYNHMHIHEDVYTYIYIYVCGCIGVCMYSYMYECIYIHTYTPRLSLYVHPRPVSGAMKGATSVHPQTPRPRHCQNPGTFLAWLPGCWGHAWAASWASLGRAGLAGLRFWAILSGTCAFRVLVRMLQVHAGKWDQQRATPSNPVLGVLGHGLGSQLSSRDSPRATACHASFLQSQLA